MTDMIGVRVVLLFESEIKTITNYLRDALEISDRHSRVAGDELSMGEFGYRSVHLIARFRGRAMRNYLTLERPWVEVQIRSILQHAWSTIGHDRLYKGALSFPDFIKRRFYAIAGGLELCDREFDSIRSHREESHKEWLTAFQSGKRFGEKMDIAGVTALLELLFPGSDWSGLPRGRPLLPAIEIALIKCLRKAGLGTARELRSIAESKRFGTRLQTFASAVGTSPGAVSNFAKAVLAIGERKSTLLLNDYVELIDDSRLREAVML